MFRGGHRVRRGEGGGESKARLSICFSNTYQRWELPHNPA